MALRPTAKDRKTRDQLVEAAHVLRGHGRDDLADAVDYVLSPKGWPMLGRLRAEAGPSEIPTNLPIAMQRPVRDHIKRSAEAAGEDLTETVNAGLRAFVEGAFRPGRPARAQYGTAGDRVNLNLRPDAALRARADEVAAAVEEELGWRPRVSTLALLWLLERYPLPETAGAEQQ